MKTRKSINIISCLLLAVLALVPTSIWAVEYNYTALLPSGWSNADAYDINANNVVVGRGYDGTMWKGYIYSGGSYTELQQSGWSSVEAYGINDSGAVVGYGYDGTTKGFFYSGGIYTDLLPPGWTSAEAYDINDNGSIVGWGYDSTGIRKGFIATVVPEPISSILFVTGGMFLAGRRFLRKKKKA